MLGFLDADDETNIPTGLSALVRNCAFDLTSVRTRDGISTTMQGVNKSPVSGLIGALYTPETATDTFFQLPTIFDMIGQLQYESPVGSGRMLPFAYNNTFAPPANAHMIAVQTYNKVFMAFSNLSTPLSGMGVLDPKTKNIWPYGLKPFGWTWLASTPVLVGEMATPTVQGGNGHTYRCVTAGTTGLVEPVWPVIEGGTIADGTAEWEEYTAVLANRLSTPASQALTLAAGGAWGANEDVYVVITLLNGMGESLASAPVLITTTMANQTVQVPIPTLAQLPGWMSELVAPYAPTGANVYVAGVAHSAAAPPLTSYQKANSSPVALGGTYNSTAAGSGAAPPSKNTARVTPGQLPTPDVQPVIQRVPAGGMFAAGRDVYVLITYTNSNGETMAGPANSIVNTELDDAIQVTVAVPEDENGNALYSILEVGVYEADVPTGTPAPDSSIFQLFGYYIAGATPTITASATGVNPPTSNGTGPGGAIVADTSTGGINESQGYRYAAIMYMNQNYTVSGFTAASVIKYDVDEDGWELAIFKVATGPAYVLGRAIAFTVADGTNDGPFWWIGNVNLQVPSQNFVYPDTFPSDNINQSATFFLDNLTATGTFNFTDEYLDISNDVTDRLDVIWPNQAVHVTYCPSVDRIFQAGVPGYYSGWWVSLAKDPESYYADLSYISVGSDDGERSWGTLEYRGTIYGLRERSGYTLSANPNNPQSWNATKRWSEVGPCGPRAFDSCGMFMMFVHRSGIYKYEDTNPDLMTKEIPYWWKTVNWLYAHTICCKIDHEKHEVHILVPVGNSKVPNQEVVLNYLEGWQNPIHFSIYSGREISVDACRKYSINDVAAFVCDRMERNLPLPPAIRPAQGSVGIPFYSSVDYTTQFVYGSSAADGTVQAVTPGIFNDNGAGIDCVYETVAPQTTMALCKIEGFTLNARGNGTLYPYFLAARAMVTGQGPDGPLHGNIIACRPIQLDINEMEGLSRMVPSKLNEKWRMRFSNGRVPDAWFSLKWLAIYSIPMYSARDESESGG
jgi:hypothetical protein